MMNARPSFSWSKSRYETFKACKQQYYFNYYGYWNGWKLSSPQNVRMNYYLKNLRTLDSLIGVVVHECAKDFWIFYKNEGTRLSLADLKRRAIKLWDIYEKNTYEKHYRNKKKTLAFHEFNYGYLKEGMVENARQKTMFCLSNFYNFATTQQIFPERILSVEDDSIGFFNYALDRNTPEIRVYAITDLIYKASEKTIIVDWKTGLEDDLSVVSSQLFTYGLWAFSTYMDLDADNVAFQIVNLTRGDNKIYEFETQQFLDFIKSELEPSIREMLVMDANMPTRFEFAQEEAKCGMCAFKELCPKFAKG